MVPCVATVEGVHAQVPLQATWETTVDAMFTPELQAHCVIYELLASEFDWLGQSLHDRFIAGFHWPAMHDVRGGGDGGDGGGGGGGGDRGGGGGGGGAGPSQLYTDP